MNVANLTAIVIAAAALATVVLSVYWNRVKTRQTADSAAAKAAAKRIDDDARRDRNSNASWASFNESIVKERDALQARLDRQNAEHTAAIEKLGADHQRKVADLSARLAECQAKVTELTQATYEMWRLLPPESRPPFPSL